MSKTPTADTRASDVYSSVRADILNGVFEPGAHLKTTDLCERYGPVSLTVVRDALTRLAAQRLVTARRNQGFFVSEITAKGIQDLTAIRILNEGRALTLSIERGGFDWESGVVAAHHILRRVEDSFPDRVHGTPESWAEAHRAFHKALISACDVPILLDICDSLLDESELYRRVASRVDTGGRDVTAEHEAIMDAAISGDSETALSLFTVHLERTAATVLLALSADSGLKVPAAH